MEYVIKSNNPNESEVARMIEQVRRQPVQIMKKDDCKVVPVIDRNKWKPCEYCSGDVDDRPFLDSKDLYIAGNNHISSVNLEGDLFPVEYCPVCGYPLTEQAWKELERKVCGE